MNVSGMAAPRASWRAVEVMTVCVALLIAFEFMPVSLFTPMTHDLGPSAAIAARAISISGFLPSSSACWGLA